MGSFRFSFLATSLGIYMLGIGFLGYLSVGSLQAQKYFNNNFYLLNHYSYNPAYVSGETPLFASVQFSGHNNALPESPRTTSIFLKKGFLKNAGIGTRMRIDSRGVFKTVDMSIDAGYQVVFNPKNKHRLRMAMSGGFYSQSIDISLIEQGENTNMNDPLLSSSQLRQSNMQLGFSAVYQIAGFELGVSAPFILGLYPSVNTSGRFWNHFSYALSYDFFFGRKDIWRVKPFVLAQRTTAGHIFDASMLVEWKKIGLLQMTYRSNGTVLPVAAIRIAPVLLGYALELPLFSFSKLAGASHAVMLSFEINEDFLSPKRRPKRRRTKRKKSRPMK